MALSLVTGGGGFIGSNLVEAILGKRGDVRVLDNFSTGRRENLRDAASWAEAGGGTFELLEGDIRDRDTCHRAVRGVDYVLHQAAIPSVQRSVGSPMETHEVNLTGTLNLLVAARDAGVSRFIYASSSSLYGESEILPKVESMAPAPVSPYGLQKLAGETYCRLFHQLYGFETLALRYFNIFGPRQDPNSDYSAVVPRFVSALRDGRPPTIYGDGEQTRDFTYISNAVQANLLACEADADAVGQAYNVACGERISLNELARILGGLAGTSIKPEYGAARPGDIRHSLAGIDRARERLGYHPDLQAHEGLRRTWQEL